ncbi:MULTISPECIES: hypothetical protein [Nostocaceae]|uniref:hypothetical protein n=1 Tax=Nostocaceae TaxID=1162 RepID=UPI00168828DC|nr:MULTISPECIES: hypothetical protein [Nostocaceae]MBD2298290.1 hypothetical protein [Nostoc sp. FACHB-190]MBD2474157.1 hypothetical protein [Anabaena sp. FACHB-83]
MNRQTESDQKLLYTTTAALNQQMIAAVIPRGNPQTAPALIQLLIFNKLVSLAWEDLRESKTCC